MSRFFAGYDLDSKEDVLKVLEVIDNLKKTAKSVRGESTRYSAQVESDAFAIEKVLVDNGIDISSIRQASGLKDSTGIVESEAYVKYDGEYFMLSKALSISGESIIKKGVALTLKKTQDEKILASETTTGNDGCIGRRLYLMHNDKVYTRRDKIKGA